MKVNGLRSKRYNLYTELVSPTVPEEYSIVLARAIPTLVPTVDPLVVIFWSSKSICLYGVVSPLIKVISGVLYTLVILRKFPMSYAVDSAFTLSKLLAL